MFLSFFKNSVIIFSSSLLAQIVNFTALVIVAKLYLPSDFGGFASVLAIVSIFIIVFSFQIPTLILAIDKKKVSNYCSNHIVIVGLISVILSCVIFVFSTESFPALSYVKKIIYILLLTSTGILLTILQAWLMKLELMKSFGLSLLIKATFLALFQYLFGIKGDGNSYSLLTALFSAEIIASLYSLLILYVHGSRIQFVQWKLYLKNIFKQGKDYSLWGTLQDFMNAIAHSAPILILAIFYNSTLIGLYAFSYRILEAGVSLISSSLRSLMLKNLSELQNNKAIFKKFLYKTWLVLTFITISGSVLMFFIAEYLFNELLDEKWGMASGYFIYLIPWFSMLIINIPATALVKCFGVQSKIFAINLYIMLSRIIVLFLLCSFDLSLLNVVLYFSLYNVLCNVLYIWKAHSKGMDKLIYD